MEIVRKSALKVVGLPVHAPSDQRWIEMPKAWKTFFARSDDIAHRVGETFIDITLGRREGVSDELLCSEVSEIGRVPEEMIALEIPAQSYLHHRAAGPAHSIASAHGEMLAWARANGCSLDEFKLDFGYTKDGSENEHELYVKVLSLR